MPVYSTVHTTKAYDVATYNYGYERANKRDNFLICFAGDTGWHTLSALIERESKLTSKQRRIVAIVKRKYGVK